MVCPSMGNEHSRRIPHVVERSALSEEARQHYDHILETRGRVSGPFNVLLNSPEVAGRVGRLGAYLRFDGTLPASQREVAILTTAREFDCAYEWSVHEELAREAGVSSATVNAVREGAPLGDVPESEARIVRYVREVLRRNEISDDTFNAVSDEFGTRATTELTATIGYYGMLAVVLNAFEVQPDTDTLTK